MKKPTLLLMASLLLVCLCGCANQEGSYTDYRGVKVADFDIALMEKINAFNGINMSSDDVVRDLAYLQVQVAEAERLGLAPDYEETKRGYIAEVIEPIMAGLASDDPFTQQGVLLYLDTQSTIAEDLGMSTNEFAEYQLGKMRDFGACAALMANFYQSGPAQTIETYQAYVESLFGQYAEEDI